MCGGSEWENHLDTWDYGIKEIREENHQNGNGNLICQC